MISRFSTCIFLALFSASLSFADEGSPTPPTGNKDVGSALRFKTTDIDGEEIDLAKFKGHVLLFVNVASECGQTPQYEKLQVLHKVLEDKGFSVLGFPTNEFGKQEPGTEAEIKAFCTREFGVTFPMFSKVLVKGEGACELYKHLSSASAKPKGDGGIGWNFEKVLVGRDGEVKAHFDSNTEPDDQAVIAALKEALAEEK